MKKNTGEVVWGEGGGDGMGMGKVGKGRDI